MRREAKLAIIILLLLAGAVAGFLIGNVHGRRVGNAHGRREGRIFHVLACQMYGDLQRQSWEKIISDGEARARAFAFYGSLTNSIADIRAITFGLHDYLANTNIPPQTVLHQQTAANKKIDLSYMN